jgi:hypothetical protein
MQRYGGVEVYLHTLSVNLGTRRKLSATLPGRFTPDEVSLPNVSAGYFQRIII